MSQRPPENAQTFIIKDSEEFLGDNDLISRSQAKRLLTRFDRFKEIVLDFQNVDSIGQAFADEIFRVFKNEHPNINLHPVNANEEVMRMIVRAQNVT
jgi:hypothetical protein